MSVAARVSDEMGTKLGNEVSNFNMHVVNDINFEAENFHGSWFSLNLRLLPSCIFTISLQHYTVNS